MYLLVVFYCSLLHAWESYYFSQTKHFSRGNEYQPPKAAPAESIVRISIWKVEIMPLNKCQSFSSLFLYFIGHWQLKHVDTLADPDMDQRWDEAKLFAFVNPWSSTSRKLRMGRCTRWEPPLFEAKIMVSWWFLADFPPILWQWD